jgi:hypothetical protein
VNQIKELTEMYISACQTQHWPISKSHYVVTDEALAELPEEKQRPLTQAEIRDYLHIVGCCIWFQRVRFDIILAVLYLTWFTKNPLVHHMDAALHLVGYLHTTMDYPLILGGQGAILLNAFSDASLGTGRKLRSIVCEIVKMDEDAKSGAISVKAGAIPDVSLSSFEAELEGQTRTVKTLRAIGNFLDDLDIVDRIKPSMMYNDNEPALKFINRDGGAKGARHMQMRLWYVRLELMKGDINAKFIAGKELIADKLTKPTPRPEFEKFVRDVMGWRLTGYTAHT